MSALERVLAACWTARVDAVAQGDTNSRGGPSCGITTEIVVCDVPDVEQTWGAYRTDSGAPEHVWLTLPDGTIVDPTADQFDQAPVVVLRPGDPGAERYLPGAEGDDIVGA